MYENLTNDANADALQAQIINSKEKTTLNIYRKFGADKKPLFNKISTISHHIEGNDTTGFFLINPSSGKLQTIYMSVKGIKLPVVINHEFKEGNDSAVSISVYDYNWQTQKGILKYTSLFEQAGNITKETPIFLLRKAKTTGLRAKLGDGLEEALGGVLPEVYPRFSASISGLELVIGGALAYLISDLVLETYFEGVNLPDLLTDGNTAEIIPSKNPPKASPINNPATGNNNPTPNLPPSECSQITFDVTMGAEGNIIVSNINGGTGPYEYRVGISSSFDGSPITSNKYEEGTYIINVKDVKGCIGVRGVTLKRENDLASILINGTLWKWTSYVVDGYDYFTVGNFGNKECDDKLFEETRQVLPGTGSASFTASDATRSTGNMVISGESEYQDTYNCETKSYEVTHSVSSNTYEWKIDKETGKFMLGIGDDGELREFAVSTNDTKINFSGTVIGEDGVPFPIIIRIEK